MQLNFLSDVPNAVSVLMGVVFGACGEWCMPIPLVVAARDGWCLRFRPIAKTALLA